MLKRRPSIPEPSVDDVLNWIAEQSQDTRVRSPFVGPDGRTYWTDGRVCVRTKAAGSEPPTPDRPLGPSKLDWECGGNVPVEIPAVDAAMYVAEECEECCGLGIVTCDYDHEHDCPVCDGAGWCALDRTDYGEPIDVGHSAFDPWYLWLLSRFPNMRARPAAASPEPPRAMYFSGDGFEAILMPRTK